jgi:hypothetical protein
VNDSASNRPTVWIVIAAVCALAAIGLGIWGVTTNSDLDDANARVDELEQQGASEEQTAEAQEQRLQAFGQRERAAYRRVRRRLLREDATAAALQKSVKDEAARLDKARQEVTAAQGADEKTAAQLKEARARAQLALACSNSAVDAMNRFLDASSASAGARAAVKQLQDTSKECANATARTQE